MLYDVLYHELSLTSTSIWPSAAGQYHWAVALAPTKWKVLVVSQDRKTQLRHSYLHDPNVGLVQFLDTSDDESAFLSQRFVRWIFLYTGVGHYHS